MDKDFLVIRKMKSGDELAMEGFVRKYYPLIFRYCRYHISDREYAEDIVQETFERFFRSLAGYEHYGKALNYLYSIASNLCKDFYKESVKTYKAETEEVKENQIEEAEDRLIMDQALHKLPDEFREIIILYYFQDLKLHEIAAVLHIGLPLVKYRMKRAREQLGELLGKEENVR